MLLIYKSILKIKVFQAKNLKLKQFKKSNKMDDICNICKYPKQNNKYINCECKKKKEENL